MKTSLDHAQALTACLMRIKTTQPLIHNITNYVVMSLNANALLAIGASPVMAHAIEEVADFAKLAQALIINIGTLDSSWVRSMQTAMEGASPKIPIIFDPVGVGATHFRTKTAQQLLTHVAPQVIRGNAAEIIALAGSSLKNSKGVDSTYQSSEAYEAAKILSAHYNCVVIVSGAQDFIISKDMTYFIDNGHAIMSKVTGMGCTATALIGAFCAIESDYFTASVYAMAAMGIAGELAAIEASGPGSFQVAFVDQLYHLSEQDLSKFLKLTQQTP